MAKYDPLYLYLKNNEAVVTLSFDKIEQILGFELPFSAKHYEAWWANEDVSTTTHSHCKSWQYAGYKQVGVDLKNGRVTFERDR